MIGLNINFKLFLSSCLIFLQVPVFSAQNDGRIVGGYSVAIDQAPFLVQIKNEDEILCGGTLVTRRHVVTAAHCFNDDPQDLLVVGGATRTTDNGTARSRVSAYVLHKAFNQEGYDMDIAVIRLKTPLKGRAIKPIALNCAMDWRVGETVKLFGWGQLDENSDSVPIDLQTVEVQVFDKNICAYNYRFQRELTDSMVCAAAPHKDACNGDSGGPAIMNQEFCGVISWGSGCAQEDAPGVYTNINVVKSFITAAIKKLK